MGLLLRNAEKLGLHRDGTLLGLGPVETEDRRRLWWQLQHMDLFLAVRCGLTPMTLSADWDTKLPLNIEDHDLNTSTKNAPTERKGLTSMSYCLFCYSAIQQQREMFQSHNGRFALSWQSNIALPPELRCAVVNQMESYFNEHFLQYCDPIKPLHLLIQIVARYLVTGFQLRILYVAVCGTGKTEISDEDREGLFEFSIRCLKYNIALGDRVLAPFRWRIEAMFPWHAFMYVLVEAARGDDKERSTDLWDLLATVYEINPLLFELVEDRRKFYAAELVIAAWNYWKKKFNADMEVTQPAFVSELHQRLASHTKNADAPRQSYPLAHDEEIAADASTLAMDGFLTEADFSAVFDMDVPEIDWSFWNSMD